MATSGSTTVKVTNWDSLVFSWELVRTYWDSSRSSYYAVVSWKLELVSTSDGAISSTASKKWSVAFGTKEYSGTNTIGIGNNSRKTLASGTHETGLGATPNSNTVYHRPYSFSQEFGINFSGEQIGTISGSGKMELKNELQAAVLKASNGTLGTEQTLNFSLVTNTLRYKLSYVCGSASGDITGATPVALGTSRSWTPPISLAAQNTAGTSVPIKLTLTTYQSDSTTVIGTSTQTITCDIPASVKPSCSAVLEDITGVDDFYGSPVQGLSKIKITVTPTLAHGSPIATYAISANGAKYSKAEATTGALLTAGDSPVVVTVTDKRGRSGTWSYTMKVKAYTAPTITALTVHRCNADGSNNDQGAYIRVVFSAAISSMDGKNTAAYKLRYKKSTATAYTEVNFSDLANVWTVTNREYIFAADDSSSYDVDVTATDRHSSVPRATSASTAFSLFDWHPSGTGACFGGVSERERTLQNNLALRQVGNTYAHQPSAFDGAKGYTLLATVELKELNVNAPIVFEINRRGALCPMRVYVRFASSSSTLDPALDSITYEGDNYGAFLVKAGPSAWKLFVDNTGGWSNPCLQNWYTTENQMARMTVAFPSEQSETLPQPYWRATPAPMRSLLDYIYPVGSIYLSYSHVSPADLFGGTWARLENAFLWATSATGTIGQTGGEREVTLTTDQIPAHSHGSVYSQHATGTKDKAWYNTTGSAVAYGPVSTGGGEAHNNMPPYIQVSAWRRTA